MIDRERLKKPARGSHRLELARERAKVSRQVDAVRQALGRVRGPTAQRRAKKHARLVEAEVDAKGEVRARDCRCRWPYCPCQSHPFAMESSLEVSHCVQHKGMGGDPQMIRTRRDQMILVCRERHLGTNGIDAGRAKVVPLTERGTDGPCEFFQMKPGEAGEWYSVGITFPPEAKESV